ncbi:MAG: phage late control D family protein [Myxococcota bacterium]
MTIGGRTFKQNDSQGFEQLVLEDHVDMVEYLQVRLGGTEAQPKWGITIGDAVEVKLGEGGVLMFKGEVTALEPSWSTDGLVQLNVRALDHCHRLARGRKTRFFEAKKDSEVATTVGAESGLSVDADTSEPTHPYILQRNESNLAFLKRLAARNNFLLAVDEGKLLFKKADFSGSGATIKMGENLRSLRMSFNTSDQVQKCIVRGWDILTKTAFVGTATTGDIEAIGDGELGADIAAKFGESIAYVTDVPIGNPGHADTLAKAEINRIARQFCHGSGTMDGSEKLRAGQIVKFEGLQAGHNGKFYIVSSRHIITASQGYLTEFTFCSNTLGS